MRDIDSFLQQLQPHVIIRGSIFPEDIQVIMAMPLADSVRIFGKGLKTNQAYDNILSLVQLNELDITPDVEPFDGDAKRFRLGIEAMRLGLAYEYDPYFSLSIARVDPLPHQLEAVYDYFLKLPRIRFLLADDPGAGKTIMAGLLIKELKIRGLIKRVLIVTPANLSFQWQREMKDRFRETFEIVRGDILRANYGANPWQDKNQVITSISWVSRIEDANESLLRSHWDLIIVDEAHKMSAYSADKKTLAYKLGESLSEMTDHYLLMTATPHKGDPGNFCLFLELLDKDVYGDVKSLEEAMRRQSAPFYLRRVKEALVTFPNPDTGEIMTLFTKRNVQTAEFQIDLDEMDFYEALTRYVEDQSIKAAQDDSARGRALGFTMALLQRRFASSVYAVRKTLERMKLKREQILADPEAYKREQINKKLPEDFDDLPEEEQAEIIAQLEGIIVSLDPVALKEEIIQLGRLIDQAVELEKREAESKLTMLKDTLIRQGLFENHKMKLLIFTEHKDTLTYLVAKLQEWGLNVTQIHGGMKIGDRNTPGTRIYAEREFKEECQVMVATEAAGEGINLQFCWFMINYDIPWNPVRLEQRMGRIHRYGQEKDCLILNFVSTNTREGRVLGKLFERIRTIEEDLDPRRTGKIFNVLGDIFPANELEKMVRNMYMRNTTEDVIKDRIIKEVDTERFKNITHSALEGLAKKELNLSAIIGKSAEARERRLVPEVIEDFFLEAGKISGVPARAVRKGEHIYRSGRVPRPLWQIGEELEPRFGKLGHEYKMICFNKEYLKSDPTLEWVTPGHPLFETVRADILQQVQEDLKRGSIFYDLHRGEPYRLDVYSGAVKDGTGNVAHRRLFVIETSLNGNMAVRQATIFLDLIPATEGIDIPSSDGLPGRENVEKYLLVKALQPLLNEVSEQREKETEIISEHLQISLKELINRQNLRIIELYQLQDEDDPNPLLEANIKKADERIDELHERMERRLHDLAREKSCTIGEIVHYGRAWVLPHPDRAAPGIAPMVRDEEIEAIAVKLAMEYEIDRGWNPVSVEKENRGFDLISRKPHAEDPETAVNVRFIEVKGRAGIGEIALTGNEYKTAERLKDDYWLYVVFNCASDPRVYPIQNPARLGWQPIVKIEHYHIGADVILEADK